MTLEMKRKLYKWTCVVAFMLVCIVIQTTLLSDIRVLGCTPSLIPFIIAVIALHEGVEEGMIAGVAGGLLCDAVYSGYEGFYIIMFSVLAFLICMMNTYMYWKNYGMAVLDWTVMIIILHFVHYCFYMLLVGSGGISSLLYVMPGEFLATLPFTPFLYIITIKIIDSFKNFDEG